MRQNFIRDDTFIDSLLNAGTPVYSEWWDAGSPGIGAGVEVIWKFDGVYFVVLTFEDHAIGPFDGLAEALKDTELNFILSAVTEIECCELEDVELAPILHSLNEPGFKLRINGVTWRLNEMRQFEPVS